MTTPYGIPDYNTDDNARSQRQMTPPYVIPDPSSQDGNKDANPEGNTDFQPKRKSAGESAKRKRQITQYTTNLLPSGLSTYLFSLKLSSLTM
jgi:hypothetical protein